MCPLQSKHCPFVLNQCRTVHPASRNFNPGGFECCNSSWENVSLVTYKILVTFYAILTSHLSQFINCVVAMHRRILELKTRAIMFWFKQGEYIFFLLCAFGKSCAFYSAWPHHISYYSASQFWAHITSYASNYLWSPLIQSHNGFK